MTALTTFEDAADSENLPTEPPESLGHSVKSLFCIDPSYTHLNSGSFGVLPKHVEAACISIGKELEASPDIFVRNVYPRRLNGCRARLASLIGADVDECVLVPNASTGINTVLQNIDWTSGDTIVGATTSNLGISKSLQRISDTHPAHPALSPFALRFPTSHAQILADFRAHLLAIKGKGKVVAVIDSIVSMPAARLPWEGLVRICQEQGAWSIVDAAHSLGQEVGIDMGKTQPDFWISNCYKWMYAKRGCALLYVPRRNHHIIKSSFPTPFTYHPGPPISDGGPTPFHKLFEFHGMIDLGPYLSVDAALDFRAALGGDVRIHEYCHSVTLSGARLLADIFGTQVMPGSDELAVNMVNIELPLPRSLTPKPAISEKISMRLTQKNVYVHHFYHNGVWWVRVMAQVFNEVADYEYLGYTLKDVCREVREEFASGA